MERGSIKEINFDLYSKKCPSNAYKQMKKFLLANGFKHRLWSGYISKEKMTQVQVAELNVKLWNTFPWLEDCVRRMDITNVGAKYDLVDLHYEQKSERLMEVKKDRTNNKKFKTMSMQELKQEVSKRGKEADNIKGLDIHKASKVISQSLNDKER